MISEPVRTALSEALGADVEFDVPMARHTALRVGGPADAFASPRTREALSNMLRLANEHDLSVTSLGSGFNSLVRDGGVDGIVVSLKKIRDIRRDEGGVRAEAGASHSSVTRFCIKQGLTGLEFAAGIPGTVGGWIAMNAGIGSREMIDVVRSVEVMSADGSAIQHFDREGLDFTYRAARGLPAGAIIISALFDVAPGETDAIQAEVDRLLANRANSQPLNVPSCGSVFKNPAGDYAGRLIEAAGLKGEKLGGAQISPVHANFIATSGSATAGDVQALIQRAQDEVERQSGIRLSTEVKIVGREA